MKSSLRASFALASAALLAAPCALLSPPVLAQTQELSTPGANAPRPPMLLPPLDEEGAPPQIELTPQLFFQVLAAEIAFQRGQVGSAAATLVSLAGETRDPRVARRATELALLGRAPEIAFSAAKLWHELSPKSALAARTLETLLLASGRLDQATPLTQHRFEVARTQDALDDFFEQSEKLLLRSPDRSAALRYIQQFAAQAPASARAQLAVAAIAQAAGDRTAATQAAQTALERTPDDEITAVRVARYLHGSVGAPRAVTILEGFIARHPDAVEARYYLARLLAAQGKTAQARSVLESGLADDPRNPGLLLGLAQIQYQAGELEAAADAAQRLIDLPEQIPRDDGPAWLLLAQIAEDRGDLAKALELLDRAAQGEETFSVALRRAQVLARLGKVEEAQALLEQTTPTSSREASQLISARASLLRDADRAPEALDLLTKALGSRPDDPDLLYDQAMMAERLNRLDVMETSLRHLIAVRPDFAHAYNALGYSLADRNQRLPEALKLIQKGLELAPDDPHILDSLGWVLFRQGHPEQALEPLRRAFDIRPDVEVSAHLGEVLWNLGRQDEARALWRAALDREPGNALLKSTLARLDVSL